MKTLIVYSSLTGNTKKVAEAIASILPSCDIFPVQEAPSSTEGYGLVAVGYWVDKGMPDSRTMDWLKCVRNSRIAFFGTLGAYPDSDHARECMAKGELLVSSPEKGNTIFGSWLCQGRIDPKVIEAMAKMAGNIHPMTPERLARIKEASHHPDEKDLLNAQNFIRSVLTATEL